MQRSNSAKVTKSRDAKSASEPRSLMLPREEVRAEDPQLALAFDVVVWDVPAKAESAGWLRPAQELTEEAPVGERQAAKIVQRLYTARKLAADTQHELDKRIKEVRREMRRAAAA